MFKYETHLHTYPVSKCGLCSVRENLEFYKSRGYDGVFITNHFLDGNINIDADRPYEEKIEFYFSDYEEGVKIGEELGIKVFFGAEMSYKGTDFLVYGLDKEWFLSHPEIMEMKKSIELPFLMEQGALVIQAHPFREASYIDHIRLFPRGVEGIETVNACRKESENKMADIYAEHYGFLKF
ncbi:MAG: histidinol phosphatase, partial [Clostridia bacterium]|nr:histidinol phosphatase [Clostridia bacterium]